MPGNIQLCLQGQNTVVSLDQSQSVSPDPSISVPWELTRNAKFLDPTPDQLNQKPGRKFSDHYVKFSR